MDGKRDQKSGEGFGDSDGPAIGSCDDEGAISSSVGLGRERKEGMKIVNWG